VKYPEPPLHVRVAEALGWTLLPPDDSRDTECGGTEFWRPPGTSVSYCNACRPEMAPPRYDTDWAATGPWIEKYGISLLTGGSTAGKLTWTAHNQHASELHHPAPLIAVCNLLLALKEADKL
jgi:hypothetical protein